MRRTILAALAALAVLPALAFASAPRAARYEAYPAVGWQTLDDAEQKRLTRIACGGVDCESLKQEFDRRWRRGDFSVKPPDRVGFGWRLVPAHPALSQLLPGASFYLQHYKLNASMGGGFFNAVALYDGRLYELRSLNKLLVDCGFKFDTSEVPAIAKIAVLWSLMEQQASFHHYVGDIRGRAPDSAALATAIPAVTFRKIERRPISILVEVDIAGKTSEVELGVRPGGYMPEGMTLDGQQWGPFFNHPSLCPTAPPAPQK
ncbi:MAG: hypothetical protein R6X13_01830 [bacterium]